MACKLISIFPIAILLCQWQWAIAEFFTAIAEVKPLLETHKRIIEDLDFYIEKEEKRLSTLKSHLDHYKKEHNIAMQDIPMYLENPINAFTLIKRLTTDLHLINTRIKKGTAHIKNTTLYHPNNKYPTLEDVKGAAQALMRLQETYLLDVHDLAEGMLNGVEYGTPLNTDDCYELGKALYFEAEYKNAVAWLTEAYKKYDDEVKYSFAKVDVIEYIMLSNFLLGDLKKALEWTYTLLEIEPTHERALANVLHFKKAILAQQDNLESSGETSDPKQDLDAFMAAKERITLGIEKDSKKSLMRYKALCRGEMDVAREISKNLKCFYTTENHPFLKYAPIKTEQVYIKPDMFIFHEVLSDSEIKYIKSIAMPRFQRATVVVTKGMATSKYRISKSAWVRDTESVKIAKISQRVKDMTGLSMDYAEDLQVANYGIGGHYEPHFDFLRAKEMAVLGDPLERNRIATVLFYMSEVAQGGATVFTELGLTLFPIKGAAAFWLNLHPSGQGDMATRHAACPVLRGSKWVSNKWINLNGQEFIKPCNLVYQAEGIAHRIPRPIPKTSR